MKTKKVIYMLLMILILELVIYKIGELCGYRAFLLTSSFDDLIPFIKYFIYFYISWYVFIFVVPYVISLYDKEKFYKYISTAVVSLMIALIIFVLFPTIMTRPLITDTDFTSKIITLLYQVSSPSKCIPSLHVVFSVMFVLPLIKDKKMPRWFKVLTWIFTIGIILSTLFIKQHMIYDVISGIAVCLISWFIVNKFKLHKYLKKLI